VNGYEKEQRIRSDDVWDADGQSLKTLQEYHDLYG